MKKQIKLGFNPQGNVVFVKPSHLIVTGITQLSGKTTTLEALIKRSGLKAIVFKTKIGEKSFSEGTEAAPFFKDRSDYEFVKSLIEAYAREKLFLEKGTLMRLCKGTGSLLEIKKRVDEELATGKMRGIKEEIHTRLQHYLENLIPQIQYANFSNVLQLADGINIMNLERFTEEAQSLIIQSVSEEVLKNQQGVIIVIPEAWKFLPQKYNNPCKRSVESFIRQGAARMNFVWIDSQDMAGVDKTPLKQISTWILGYQSERNEVKHTLDQISLPKKSKPTEEDIMTLKIGHFYLSSYEGVTKVYVQPVWMDDATAEKVALGKIDVESTSQPETLVPYAVAPQQAHSPGIKQVPANDGWRKEVMELRQDFFNKVQELSNGLQKVFSEMYTLKNTQTKTDEAEIISKVLQKVAQGGNTPNMEAVVKEVLKRVPANVGGAVYKVAPLEKIKKDFLEQARQEVVGRATTLDAEQKKMLLYIETQSTGQKLGTIIEKCLFKSQESGGTRASVGAKLKDMVGKELVRYDAGHSTYYPIIKDIIAKYVGQHGATAAELQQVYDHILAEVSA